MAPNSNEYMKNYYNTQHKESIVCEDCGGKYKKFFIKVHQKSKKHTRALEKKNEVKLTNSNNEIESLKTRLEEMESMIRILQMAKGYTDTTD